MSEATRLTGADIESALVAAGIPHKTPLWEVDWDAVAVELDGPPLPLGLDVERLRPHVPWARAVFAEQAIWLACECGWNAMGGVSEFSWMEHVAYVAFKAQVSE